MNGYPIVPRCRCLFHHSFPTLSGSFICEVQALRDQLQETKSRLNETQSENERLRYLFGETD
ncbi:hypothetical protein AAVH_40301, partial [Aphelenchoides avenae]